MAHCIYYILSLIEINDFHLIQSIETSSLISLSLSHLQYIRVYIKAVAVISPMEMTTAMIIIETRLVAEYYRTDYDPLYVHIDLILDTFHYLNSTWSGFS